MPVTYLAFILALSFCVPKALGQSPPFGQACKSVQIDPSADTSQCQSITTTFPPIPPPPGEYLGRLYPATLDACASNCYAHSRCASFEFGYSDGSVSTECWLFSIPVAQRQVTANPSGTRHFVFDRECYTCTIANSPSSCSASTRPRVQNGNFTDIRLYPWILGSNPKFAYESSPPLGIELFTNFQETPVQRSITGSLGQVIRACKNQKLKLEFKISSLGEGQPEAGPFEAVVSIGGTKKTIVLPDNQVPEQSFDLNFVSPSNYPLLRFDLPGGQSRRVGWVVFDVKLKGR